MPLLDLGDLVDPAKYHEPIRISAEDPGVLRDQLRQMLRIRMVEQQLARARKEGAIGGPVHLGVGQEAVAVGVSACLRSSDRVFGAHRSHAHALALGSEIHRLFAEVLGRDTGLSRGMGGSMHLWDAPRGFYGSVPIVAGTVPLAVGAALAAKLKGVADVGVSYLGDGAVEEGVVQESLNLARLLAAPVVFVVENNFFSSHMHISLRQPSNATARFAQAHDIPFAIVDGNDVVAVRKAAQQLVEHSRAGKGPGFLEAVTYRWLGHVDWREDIDVGVNRSIEELHEWRRRDPVGRLSAALEQAGEWSSERHTRLVEEIDTEINVAWDRAMADPWPRPEALLNRVYAEGPGGGAPMSAVPQISYGIAIRAGFEYLLERYPEVFVIGQGLWSPWYVGNSMTDLDKKFGIQRVIDTPVSELACTGAAVGAGLAGMRPIVVHPRMDFMLYAMDAIVNQAAKWSHMVGGQAHPAVVFRGIVNRGGEQGAQHSQSLHSWFSHIPGLRVVMPYTPTDARDLLIASTLCDDPVVYIDDRWLYDQQCPISPVRELDLRTIGPQCLRSGKDLTLVGSGFSTHLCMLAAGLLEASGISAEVFDLRVLNPLDCSGIALSVEKTGRLVVVDGSWSNCGTAGEVIAQVCERTDPRALRAAPQRVTLPAAPAPTSRPLEAAYYPTAEQVADVARRVFDIRGTAA